MITPQTSKGTVFHSTMWLSLVNEKALLIYCYFQPKLRLSTFSFLWPIISFVTKVVSCVNGSAYFLEPQVAKYSHSL